ncbi:Restriction endonuclease PvuII [anaerobic digester metagenome]
MGIGKEISLMDEGNDDEILEIQDNARETLLTTLFHLRRSESRLGADAFDELGNPFELKTTTVSGVGTGRDVSFEMIAQWRKRYWIIGKGQNYRSGFHFEKIFFLSPAMIDGALRRIEDRMRPDIELKNKVLLKIQECAPHQFSREELEKIDYLMARGSTLNNPKIPLTYVEQNGVLIECDHPRRLRELIKKHPLVCQDDSALP